MNTNKQIAKPNKSHQKPITKNQQHQRS